MSMENILFLGLLDGIVFGLIWALIALGLSLVFGVMRIVNIAHGEFYMLGAVITWYTVTYLGSFAVAIILAPLAVAGVALVVERAVLRRINYEPEATIVATIGILYIIQQIVLAVYGPYARPVEAPIYFRIVFPWFGYSGYKLVIAIASILIISFTYLFLSKTRVGLYLRATQQDREMALALGVPVNRIYLLAFGLGSALAAVAGVLVVPILQAYYLMGLDALLISFIIVIIGGLGSLKGTLVAALIIGVIDGVVSVFFSPTLAKMISSSLVAIILILRPTGLFGAEV